MFVKSALYSNSALATSFLSKSIPPTDSINVSVLPWNIEAPAEKKLPIKNKLPVYFIKDPASLFVNTSPKAFTPYSLSSIKLLKAL